MGVDTKTWALALVGTARHEFTTLIARIPLDQRNTVGMLKQWSSKDELAHLAYWIEVFAHNIQACHKGQSLIDTRDYLAMNDKAWQTRKDWAWADIETNLSGVLANVEQQIKELSNEDLTEPQRLTLEADRKSPRPLVRSLIYEVIDHPLHHFMGISKRLGDKAQTNAMLKRMLQVMSVPGTSKWSATTRNTIKRYAA